MGNRQLQIRVECYSGYKAEEKPRCFFIGGQRYEVTEIVDQWRGPDDTWFRVRADDGNLYILRHTEKGQVDTWTLESFRREDGSSS